MNWLFLSNMKSSPLIYCFTTLLIGCATTEHSALKEDIEKANRICENQVTMDQARRNSKWFTGWLECKKQRVMPFDIVQYPSKEREIRAMYDRLLQLGVAVDRGIAPVESVYNEWERMEREINMKQCSLRIVQPDGSSTCAPE